MADKTRAELRSSHGTPEEFERAVWEAHGQLFCTTDEAIAAIGKYREEYFSAPESRNEQAKEATRAALDEAAQDQAPLR